MNKRVIYIIVATVIVLLVFVGSIFNRSNDDKSSITSDHYYYSKGLEDLAKITKPAVEKFASQDGSESAGSRKARLAEAFTSDSPVYGYTVNNIDDVVVKSSAKMTSVVDFGGEDGSNSRLVSAMVRVKLQTKTGDSYFVNQTYLVAFNPDSKGEYKKAYDITEFKQ